MAGSLYEDYHSCIAVCVGQGWGPPQYRCSTSPDLLGQAVHLYQVAVPRVSATWIPGSPNTDRHLALISCAQAGLHAITTASQVFFIYLYSYILYIQGVFFSLDSVKGL